METQVMKSRQPTTTNNPAVASNSSLQCTNPPPTSSTTSTSSSSSSGTTETGRRPMNAFLLFCKRHRSLVKEKYPNLENRNITKILGEWWQSLSDVEKSSFNNLATEHKEAVMREQPNFRWRKQPGGVSNNSTAIVSKPLPIPPQQHQPAAAEPLRKEPSPSQVEQQPQQRSLTPVTASTQTPPLQKPLTVATSTSVNGFHHSENSGSNSRSGSNSPNSTNTNPQAPQQNANASYSNSSSSAPKHFKKRFLAAAAAESANFLTPSSNAAAPSSSSANDPDADACKALLQLAGVRDASPPLKDEEKAAANGGGGSPANGVVSEEDLPSLYNVKRVNHKEYRMIRDSVMSKVAATMIKLDQDKSKIQNGHHNSEDDDEDEEAGGIEEIDRSNEKQAQIEKNVNSFPSSQQQHKQRNGVHKRKITGVVSKPSRQGPLNLSSQCTIQGQTIMEHIIESILDGEETARNNNESKFSKSSSSSDLLNGTSSGGCQADEIKAAIYKGLKEDIQKKRRGEVKTMDISSLWRLLPFEGEDVKNGGSGIKINTKTQPKEIRESRSEPHSPPRAGKYSTLQSQQLSPPLMAPPTSTSVATAKITTNGGLTPSAAAAAITSITSNTLPLNIATAGGGSLSISVVPGPVPSSASAPTSLVTSSTSTAIHPPPQQINHISQINPSSSTTNCSSSLRPPLQKTPPTSLPPPPPHTTMQPPTATATISSIPPATRLIPVMPPLPRSEDEPDVNIDIHSLLASGPSLSQVSAARQNGLRSAGIQVVRPPVSVTLMAGNQRRYEVGGPIQRHPPGHLIEVREVPAGMPVTRPTQQQPQSQQSDNNDQPLNLSTTPPQTPSPRSGADAAAAITANNRIPVSSVSSSTPASTSSSATLNSYKIEDMSLVAALVSTAPNNVTNPSSALPSQPAAYYHTPAVTITQQQQQLEQSTTFRERTLSTNSEDEDVRRSARSCKGKRYQEFKDEGRLGSRRSGSSGRKSGGAGDSSADESSGSQIQHLVQQQQPAPVVRPQLPPGGRPFDVYAKLSEIPALSLEAYQQKLIRSKMPQQQTNDASGSGGLRRRRSSETLSDDVASAAKNRKMTQPTTAVTVTSS